MKHMHFSVGTPSKPAKGEAMVRQFGAVDLVR